MLLSGALSTLVAEESVRPKKKLADEAQVSCWLWLWHGLGLWEGMRLAPPSLWH